MGNSGGDVGTSPVIWAGSPCGRGVLTSGEMERGSSGVLPPGFQQVAIALAGCLDVADRDFVGIHTTIRLAI